jgi:putative PIN family toxin of toxin-antitoxin system
MKPGGNLRVVLDTNVLFSALALGRQSPPLMIVELARSGSLDAIVSPFILDELERALHDKAAWDRARLADLSRHLGGFMLLVRPHDRINAIKESEADNRILECAVAANAQVLVTGDTRHLRPLNVFQGIEILTPREFLTKYFP